MTQASSVRTPRYLALAALLGVILTADDLAAQFSGELFYTRYETTPSDPFRVKKSTFTYDGTRLQLGPRVGVARDLGADGLLFSPQGTLLVAGQDSRAVCEVDPDDGTVLGCSPRTPAPIFHLTLDPDGSRVWTSNQPGRLLIEVPLGPGPGAPIAHQLANGATVTQIVFTPRGVFYTSSEPDGVNSTFGTMDLTTFTATPKITGVDGFHGVTYDRHTGHVLTFGNRFITQIDPDPVTPTIVSRLDIRTIPGGAGVTLNIDQGASTGTGLIFAAINGNPPVNGRLVFLDIRTSRLVGSPQFAEAVPFDSALDDIAPLSGAGCPAAASTNSFGFGWRGTTGNPTLASTLPLVGTTATLRLGSSATTPTVGCLLIGTRRVDQPTDFGGRIVAADLVFESTFLIAPSGTTADYFLPFSACGARFYLQTLLLDPVATHGVAFSPGLELVVGN